MNDLLTRTEELRSGRTPYVLATVVRAERPTSAKAGDRALVLPDGTLEGFVGGTCAESTVRLQGLRLLETGDSTLLRITPTEETETAAEGVITVGNPCLSGGTLDIFLEYASSATRPLPGRWTGSARRWGTTCGPRQIPPRRSRRTPQPWSSPRTAATRSRCWGRRWTRASRTSA